MARLFGSVGATENLLDYGANPIVLTADAAIDIIKIGPGTNVGSAGIAIGHNANAAGSSHLAIGNGATAIGLGATAIGLTSNAEAESTVIGTSARDTGTGTRNVIVGKDSSLANLTGCVLIGFGLTGSENNEIKIGSRLHVNSLGLLVDGVAVVTVDTLPEPFYQHIESPVGTSFAQRAGLAFTGAGVTVTDNSGAGDTVVNIPGGAAGALQFVAVQTVTGAAAQDVTFSGLNGDADGDYIIIGRNPAGNSNTLCDIQFNGSATGIVNNAYNVNAATGAVNDDSGFPALLVAGAANESEFTIEIRSKTGMRRRGFATWDDSDDNVTPKRDWRGRFIWNNSVDNMTSITLHGHSAAWHAIGATYYLYKRLRS